MYKKQRHSIIIFQFQKMQYDDFVSISDFINEDWKQDGKATQQGGASTFNYSGRWTVQQWSTYVVYSLKQICKEIKKRQTLNSFNENRRNYTSFDRRYVQFLKVQYQIQHMSVEQEKKLIKRAKSKFNTLKRSYKKNSTNVSQKQSQMLDFQQMIYRQAKLISQTCFLKNINELIKEFQRLKSQQLVTNQSNQSDTQLFRQKQLTSIIKTRSFMNKQKQIGIIEK